MGGCSAIVRDWKVFCGRLDHSHTLRNATRRKEWAGSSPQNLAAGPLSRCGTRSGAARDRSSADTQRERKMLWLKAFHLVFVVAWFAGLFYLPRLFVYHATTGDEPGRERFKIMERRLFKLMTIGASLAALFGVSMIIVAPPLLAMGWLHVKLLLVAALVGYHIWC